VAFSITIFSLASLPTFYRMPCADSEYVQDAAQVEKKTAVELR
jgi:hypothetical protein